MTPAELLAAARALVDRPDPGLAGLWPRAAALTARQALEAAMDELWRAQAPGLERASAAAQLACLPDHLGDRALAGDAAFAWSSLSAACHHHDYELTPTAEELRGGFEVVDRLIERVGRVAR